MNRQTLLPGLLLTGSVTVLVAQPAWADVVQVTGVRLNPTANGLEVILETADGTSLQVLTSSYEQTLLIDVRNARLNLAKGGDFRSKNPVQGITSVTVTPLSSNSIRVTVTGAAAVPTAKVTPSASGLLLSLTAPPATSEATPAPVAPAP